MIPQTHVLPEHKDEAELKRLLELEMEFDRQQGYGTGGPEANWQAGWDTNVDSDLDADGDGDGE